MDHQVAVNFLAVLVVPGVSIVIQDLASVLVIEPDGEIELLVGVVLTQNLLADLQVAGFLLDVHAGHGGQGEVHVAGGAGGAALGIEEGQGMGPGGPFLQIVPQVHILAHGGVDAAEVAHQLIVQEHPHIIVAEEIVFQGPHVVRRQGELHGVLHAKEAVVPLAVITAGEGAILRGRVPGLSLNVVESREGDALAILAEVRVRILRCVQGPEVVGKNVRIGRSGTGRRVEEVLQPVNGAAAIHRGGGQRIGIAHPGKAQTAARIGVLPGSVTVIEQLRGHDPGVIDDLPVLKPLGNAERASEQIKILLYGSVCIGGAEFIQEQAVKY